ncbi:hypothetical protein [uncultured Pseudoflavonifractor sp.]|uniref:hypothetical protein n=1 Tax=uncultured Pseudoflavonifractor sp. TaxID=1221379 RepID=UPI0025D95864|nr:hypothetical protein [uncultured Pseudoflavonifractor sp.]
MLLILSFILPCFSVVSAASSTSTLSERYTWEENGYTLIDSYFTDTQSTEFYSNGETIYGITLFDTGAIEVVWADIGEPAHSLWLTKDELSLDTLTGSDMQTFKGNEFRASLKEYCLEHRDESTLVDITVREAPAITPMAEDTDVYRSLMDQLEDIHGPQHTNYNWTGLVSQIIGGIEYNYKENLSYEMNRTRLHEVSSGTSVASFLATILAFNPSTAMTFGILSAIFGGVSIITSNSELLEYTGSAVYWRYVLINGGGPYYSGGKTMTYEGWAKVGSLDQPTLLEAGTTFTIPENIFEDYERQRELAYENYV